MIVIDEPTFPTRPVAELRAAADRHASRLRRRLRRRAAGLTGAAIVTALAVFALGTSRPDVDVRTIPPAESDRLVDEAPVRDVARRPRTTRPESSAERPPSQQPSSSGQAPTSDSADEAPPGPKLALPHTKLLFVRSSGGLWELSLESGSMRKLQESGFAGRWSPDGRRIVLETGMGLALLDVASGERTVLFEQDYLEHDSHYQPAWLPDGSSIVFQQNRQTGATTWATELWVVDVQTRATRFLRTGSEVSVSRDGRILYRCDHGEYCLTDSTGADLGVVTNSQNVSHAVLSPDGRRIAGLRFGSSSTPNLVVQGLDGWGRRVLLATTVSGRPAWFPDGSRVAFSPVPTHTLEPEGTPGIWSVAVDGSDVRRHTDGGGGDDLYADLVHAP